LQRSGLEHRLLSRNVLGPNLDIHSGIRRATFLAGGRLAIHFHKQGTMVKRSCCGFDATGAPFGEYRSTPATDGTDGARSGRYCERCGAALFPDEAAALFFERLKLLGKFGLTARTRLLLGTAREDG
jgi:hypothetical protein